MHEYHRSSKSKEIKKDAKEKIRHTNKQATKQINKRTNKGNEKTKKTNKQCRLFFLLVLGVGRGTNSKEKNNYGHGPHRIYIYIYIYIDIHLSRQEGERVYCRCGEARGLETKTEPLCSQTGLLEDGVAIHVRKRGLDGRTPSYGCS